MVKVNQTKRCQLVQHNSRLSALWLVGWLVGWFVDWFQMSSGVCSKYLLVVCVLLFYSVMSCVSYQVCRSVSTSIIYCKLRHPVQLYSLINLHLSLNWPDWSSVRKLYTGNKIVKLGTDVGMRRRKRKKKKKRNNNNNNNNAVRRMERAKNYILDYKLKLKTWGFNKNNVW